MGLVLALLPSALPRVAAAEDVPSVCRMIETAAAANRLPVEFLTRLIWIESRFQSGATSPAGAEGIAQFMPGTAAERGLADPRDPQAAITHAARFLADLERQFGNLGLAAAAYNAGAARVGKWLQSAGGLPLETRLYVRAVTGGSPEDWVGVRAPAVPQGGSCTALIAELDRYGRRAAPRVAMWQVRLDGGLSRAIALLASMPAGRRPVPAAVRRREPTTVTALCNSIRSLGARCEVLR